MSSHNRKLMSTRVAGPALLVFSWLPLLTAHAVTPAKTSAASATPETRNAKIAAQAEWGYFTQIAIPSSMVQPTGSVGVKTGGSQSSVFAVQMATIASPADGSCDVVVTQTPAKPNSGAKGRPPKPTPATGFTAQAERVKAALDFKATRARQPQLFASLNYFASKVNIHCDILATGRTAFQGNDVDFVNAKISKILKAKGIGFTSVHVEEPLEWDDSLARKYQDKQNAADKGNYHYQNY